MWNGNFKKILWDVNKTEFTKDSRSIFQTWKLYACFCHRHSFIFLNDASNSLLLLFHIINLLILIEEAFRLLSFVPICSCQFIDILNSSKLFIFFLHILTSKSSTFAIFTLHSKHRTNITQSQSIHKSYTRNKKKKLDRQKIAHFLHYLNFAFLFPFFSFCISFIPTREKTYFKSHTENFV